MRDYNYNIIMTAIKMDSINLKVWDSISTTKVKVSNFFFIVFKNIKFSIVIMI